jgi:hypothetical protein
MSASFDGWHPAKTLKDSAAINKDLIFIGFLNCE